MNVRRLGALALLSLALACEPGARRPDPAATPQSSTIAVVDGTVVALDADHNAVVFMNELGGDRVSVPVGKNPTQLAVRGDRVAVSNRMDRSVTILDARSRSVVRTIPVGVEPHGLTFVEDGRLAVVLAGEQQVAIVDIDDGTIRNRYPLATPNARAIALVQGKLIVSHLLNGSLSVVDLKEGGVRSMPIRLTALSTPLNPSLVASLTASPDGREVAAPHVNTNNDNLRPQPEEGGGGYLGTPDQLPAVNPTLTTVDPSLEVMTSDASPADEAGRFLAEDCFDCGSRPQNPGAAPVDPNGRQSALLSDRNGSTGSRQLNEPVAVAYLDGGRGLAVLARGSRNVFIWRRGEDGQRKELLQVSPVGHGADGLAVSSDGRNLLVHNAFDLEISVVPLPSFEDPYGAEGSFLGRDAPADTGLLQTKDVAPSASLKIAEVTLPENVQRGRKLFFDATIPSMTQGQGVTCATCHAEGRHDGRTWQFIDGPRNTPTLAGAAEGRVGIATTTAPLHWKGELDTHQQLQRTITEFMGGGGLQPRELDDVAAFIDTIPAPDMAQPVETAEQALVNRGRELFYDETVACGSCHGGEHFTDNTNHIITDEGPQHDSQGHALRPGFQTPVLHGLSLTGPYLHDGSLPTLEAVVEELVATDRMGKGSHLSVDDRRALVAFLKTL